MMPPPVVEKQIKIDLPRYILLFMKFISMIRIWPAHPAFHGTPNDIALTELRALLRAISNAMPALGICFFFSRVDEGTRLLSIDGTHRSRAPFVD